MNTDKGMRPESALTKNGVIRAGINISNPALAKPGPDGPVGVTVDLTRKLAAALGAEPGLVVCDSAARTTDALKSGDCDIAFMAVDPAREADFRFSDVYLTIEGVYAVPADSPLDAPSDIDRSGVSVVSTAGTAYTQFLAKNLKEAGLIQAPDGFQAFQEGGYDAVAGIREAVEAFAAARGNLRVVSPCFMEIRQAIAVPRSVGPEAVALINETLFA